MLTFLGFLNKIYEVGVLGLRWRLELGFSLLLNLARTKPPALQGSSGKSWKQL